jgi:hypothetical protein
MPFITNADTNAPTILIGELCADFIMEFWSSLSINDENQVSNAADTVDNVNNITVV